MTTSTQNRFRPLRTGLTILAGILALSLVGVVGVSLAHAGRPAPKPITQTVQGDVTSAFLDIDGADVEVVFQDVESALVSLAADRAGSMTLDTDLDAGHLDVVVRQPAFALPLPLDDDYAPTVRLTLPLASAGADLRVEADLGDVATSGDFGDVTVRAGAGDVRLGGSAASTAVSSSFGDLFMQGMAVSGAVTAEAGGGDVTVDLSVAPGRLEISTGAGEQVVMLAAGSYDVAASSDLGDVVVSVPVDPSAEVAVRLDSAAGDITVLSGERAGD